MPRKSVWGLDLGAWSMKIGRGRLEKSGAVTVDLYDEINYQSLGVESDGRFLSGAAEAVEEFSKRHTIDVADDLCVSVSGSGVFSRFINLPPVPESIGEIIQYEARQQIPFDMDQVVWDYQPVKEEHEPWEEVKVGLFALKSETIEELVGILSPWRRNLRLVQQAPLAVYNFMCFEGYDSEASVVVDMGGKSTGLVVINPPEFWLRSLLVGGDALTERVESHFGVSKREAERIKERAGESGRAAQLLRVVGKPVGNILSEIQRSLGYYKSLEPDISLDRVIGVGNAFRLKGMDRVIGEGLQSEVNVLDEVKNLNLTDKVEQKIGGGLCGCCALFGLIAQGVGAGRVRVNLVPSEIALENEMRRKKPFLAGAAAGIIMIIALLIIGESLYGRRLAPHTDAGAGIAEQLQAVDREYSSIKREVNDLEEEVHNLAGREVRRDIYLHVLPEIGRALPRERAAATGALLPSAVYVNDISFNWVPKRAYENRIEDGRPPEDDEVDDGRRRGDTRDPDDDRLAEMAIEGQMLAGEDAVLVAEIECELTMMRGYESFIDDVVIESLRDSRYAKTGNPVFRDVQCVGRLRRITRDSKTGELNGSDDAQRLEFIRFYVIAGINDPEDVHYSGE